MDFLLNPWPWYVAGPMIALVMFLLLYVGGGFGVSSNLRTMCAIGGAGKVSEFFKFDWKGQIWNLVFVLGAVIGGFIACNYLSNPEKIILSANSIASLKELGFSDAGHGYLPPEIFSLAALKSVKGLAILLIGGFLVGFGTRYAGGCTSGHAISGLSNIQLPSLIAVVGFFIGGLTMIYLIFPIIF